MSDRVERTLQWLVLFGALATIPLTVFAERYPWNPWVYFGDWAVWFIFAAEFTIMFARSRNRLAYVRANWLNVAIVVLSFPLLPHLLAFTRLARIARLFRLTAVTIRGFGALRKTVGRPGLLYMVSITMLVVLASAGGLLIIEPKAVDGQFSNGLWWAIVTATTVGYGDIAPTTPLARLLGLLVMITGIGLISTVAASVTAYFVEHDEGPDLRAIAARLDRIEGLLVRIQEQQNGAAKETGEAKANASADAQAGP